jgi:hypothetical protein
VYLSVSTLSYLPLRCFFIFYLSVTNLSYVPFSVYIFLSTLFYISFSPTFINLPFFVNLRLSIFLCLNCNTYLLYLPCFTYLFVSTIFLQTLQDVPCFTYLFVSTIFYKSFRMYLVLPTFLCQPSFTNPSGCTLFYLPFCVNHLFKSFRMYLVLPTFLS